MLRHSKFEPEEIEREKGVIVEEMNMYYDTPRDYVDGVYDDLLYGDQPLGWDIIGTKETVRAATRETFLGYLDRWYRGAAHGRRASRARSASDAVDRVAALLGDVPERRDRLARPGRAGSRTRRGSRSTRRPPTRRTCASGVHSYPIGHPDRYALMLLATAPRRRDVVAALHRGAGAARPRLLHLRLQPGLHGRRARSSRRAASTSTGSTTPSPRSSASSAASPREPLERDELEKARNFAKGRLVLSLEDPKGMISFALRDEVLEGKLREPDEVLAALDEVTVEDVQRVAQDIIRQDRLNLALIGPFDEPERFQKLLELEVAADAT